MLAGSSPLTRGKLSKVPDSVSDAGLIPAHAGKTTVVTGMPSTVSAHPRSRGENHRGDRDAVNGIGSSPLTRGKRRARQVTAGRVRLIPAHAGKTPVLAS